MKGRYTRFGRWMVCLPILWVLPLLGWGQRDSIPHIVTGKFDWASFKKQVNAPVFQQNDLAIYVLRKDSLMDMIAQEESAAWIQDFHFIDINGDRWLDAFYCGPTKARGGYYTYFMLADSALQFPILLQAPGYVHHLNPQPSGLELILREDAHGKSYLHTVTEYFCIYRSHTVSIGWQLQMLSTTEVPVMRQPEAFVLRYPTELRASARVVNDPPIDYNQDGKSDALGNVIAPLEAGLPLLRVAETVAAGEFWSFVIVLATPAKNQVFKPLKNTRMAYAGWVLSTSISGK